MQAPAADHRSWPSFFRRAAGFLIFLVILDYGICAFLVRGLQRYFGLDQPVQVLCVGHSRTILGIDEALLSRLLGAAVAKFAVNGANTADRAAMVRYALAKRPGIRLVVYDVEEAGFADEGLRANSYRQFFPFVDDSGMAAYLQEQCKTPDEYWLRKVWRTSRYDEVTLWLSLRGWLGIRENLKLQKFDPAMAERAVARGMRRPVQVDDRNYRKFLDTLAFIRSRGVLVALVNMPTVDILNRLDRQKRESIRNLFRSLAARDPGILFLDYSSAFESRYDLFYDTIHLNAEGQQALTKELAARLRGFLQENTAMSLSS